MNMLEKVASQLLGTWYLVSVTYPDENGTDINYMGENPSGMLIYNTDGKMAAQFMASGRSRFSTEDWANAPLHEIKEAFVSYQSYFGRYELIEYDEHTHKGTVLHHVEGSLFPNWHLDGVTETRYFTLGNNMLTIESAPIHVLGRDIVFKLVWKR